MFSELIRRNSKRNRQENTLYFVTMILTVAAFYIILALDHQDVMIFLKEMERDAVNKLLMLIPILYVVSLCRFISWYILRISIRWNGEVMSLEPM